MWQITGIPFPGSSRFSTNSALDVGYLISRLLLFSIIGAGLYFFVRLLSAGYQYLTSAGDSGKVSGATKEITNASIGLVLILTSFFIIQTVQVIFNINILNLGSTISISRDANKQQIDTINPGGRRE